MEFTLTLTYYIPQSQAKADGARLMLVLSGLDSQLGSPMNHLGQVKMTA